MRYKNYFFLLCILYQALQIALADSNTEQITKITRIEERDKSLPIDCPRGVFLKQGKGTDQDRPRLIRDQERKRIAKWFNHNKSLRLTINNEFINICEYLTFENV